MYAIKTQPEDFVVKEILPASYIRESGPFTVFLLKKKDYNTISALKVIASYLSLPLRAIGFAGNKDRRAVTEQFITVAGLSKDAFDAFSHDNIDVVFAGYAAKELHLGNLVGNAFDVVLRDCQRAPVPRKRIVNYFGEQRFSENNAAIGKAMLRKDFKEACGLIMQSDLQKESIQIYLKKHPNDYVGALQLLPQKLLSLFLNAYQSKLWNRLVSSLVEEHAEGSIEISGDVLHIADGEYEDMPIVGFETELERSPYKGQIEAVLEKEGFAQRDFLIPQLKRLALMGSYRQVHVDLKAVSLEIIDDHAYKISFQLPKGSYATVAMRQFFI